MRTCIGCLRRAPAGELVRVARDADDGTLRIDRTAPGRGAWLCAGRDTRQPAAGCVEQAARRQAFSRAFRVKLDTAVVDRFVEAQKNVEGWSGPGAAAATGRRRD